MAAPELRLDVSLGLNTFRNQMRTLVNIAQSEFTAQLNVRFNRATLAKELDGLRRAIGRSTYKVEIGGNWENLPAKVASLQKALQDLRSSEKVELKVGGIASINSKEARRIRTALYRQLTSAGGKLLVPATITAKTTKVDRESLQKQIGSIVVPFSIDHSSAKDDLSQLRASAVSAFTGIPVSLDFSKAKTELDSFAATLKAKLSNITVNVKANLEQQAITKGAKTSAEIDADVARGLQAIREMGAARMSSAGGGSVTEAARREQLRVAISGEGVTKLKSIAGQLGVGGAGKYRTATINDLIDKIVKEASIEAITKYLDPKAMMRSPDRSGLQKALDTFARGVFRMLGMDPESIRQKRLPPAINWQATTPPSGIPIGPSSTGRMLPGGATPAILPGTAFINQKRLVGDILSAGLKEAIRNAANAFVDNVRRELVAAVRSTSVVDLGNRVKAIRPGIEPKLLTPGIGRAAELYRNRDRSEFFARREAEARARSELRSADILASTRERPAAPYSIYNRPAKPREAIIPYQGPGALVRTPEPPIAGGRGVASVPLGERGRGGFGDGARGGAGGAPFSPGGRNRNVFGEAVAGMSLPGKGVALELANEFKYATQQVLLFGAAYKALAFVQSFPAQVGEAVAQLQTFNNTLKSITPTAQEASSSNEFVLGMVERYNIPLESARSGFTKLYASMTPAGFKGDEIRDLFAGISKAAATFGMSADKVNRVTYAFAQMASKGQVMSEELKGQLGDVLPGALGLFAEAAGLKGPDAITKFTKALEDGAYKGEPMKVLLKNVSYLMNKEFGPGAEGAAKTFQGVMNRMANSTKFFYESFEPVAVAFANQVIIPISQGLRDITDGTKEFLSGQKASTESGAQFAAILKDMAPAINGIVNNIKQLGNGFSAAGQIIGNAGKAILSVLSLPIVGYLGSAYGSVLLLVGAFNLLGGQALVAAIASAGRFITMMMGLVTQSIASSAAVYGTSSALQTLHAGLIANGASLQVYRAAMIQATAATQTFGTMLQTVIIRSVVGVALVGLGLLAAKIMEVRGQMEAIQAAAKSMQEGARISAKFGLVEQTKENVGNIKAMHNTYQKLREEFKNLKGMDAGLLEFEDYAVVSTGLYKKLLELGLLQESQAQKVANGYKVTASVLVGIGSQIDEQEKVLGSAYEKAKSYIKAAEDAAARQKKQQQGLLAIPPGAPDPKAGDKAAEDARKLADDRRKYESDLMKIGLQQAMELDNIQFEHWKTLQDQKLDYEAAGQNEMVQQAIKFQKDLQAIEMRRIEAVRRARQESQKAEVDAMAATYVAEGGTVQGGQKPGAGAFPVTSRRGWRWGRMHRGTDYGAPVGTPISTTMGGTVTGTGYNEGGYGKWMEVKLENGVKAFWGHLSEIVLKTGTSFKAGELLAKTGKTGSGTGPHLHSGDASVNEALSDPYTLLGGRAIAARGAVAGPASRVRTEAKKDYNAAIQGQEAVNAKERESAKIKLANAIAQREVNTLIKEYVASIVPVEQLKLENSLIEAKNRLLSSGVYGEALDMETKIDEARRRAIVNIEEANKRIEENNQLVLDGKLDRVDAVRLNEAETKTINDLRKELELYIPLLRQRLELERQQVKATLEGEIKRATPLGGMGLAAGFIGPSGTAYEKAIEMGGTPDEAKKIGELTNQLTMLQVKNEGVRSSILAIGDAFGTAMTTGIASLVDGTGTAKEVFSNFLKSIGQALLQAAAQMIATYIAIGIARIFAGLGGGAKTPIPGAAPQMTPGAIVTPQGFQGQFGQVAANGAVWKGGFTPFANGGIVNGPTLGLVGEGRYNEAIVPLPDGRSIPVVMRGDYPSSRDLLSSNGGAGNGSPVLSMNFTTTTINGVEYVSRDQLEAAMMETRKLAAREGAQRGAVLAIDKLQQSPTTRRRIGL